MDHLYQHNKLNKYLIKITDSYVGIYYDELINLEKEIYDKKIKNNKLILLCSKLKDNSIYGIFTSRKKAKQYIIREYIIKYLKENKIGKIDMNTSQEIIHHMSDCYTLINVYHINKKEPVFLIKRTDILFFDSVSEYLTNDPVYWANYNTLWDYTDPIIKLDPKLSEFC